MELFILTLILLYRLIFTLFGLGLLLLALMILWGLWRRRRDPALAYFNAFPAVIEHEDGARHAGVLRVQRDGVTLEFAIPATGHNPPIPITYLHYHPEFQTIHAIYRFLDELDKKDRSRRQQQVDAVADFLHRRRKWHPGTWADRLIDLFVALWMKLRGRSFPHVRFLPHPTTHGRLLVGLWGDAHNQILASHLGRPVVVRHQTQQTLHRHQGLLITYSRDFLLIAGSPISQQSRIPLNPQRGTGQEYTLRWRWQDDQLDIRNTGTYPLLLDRIQVGETSQALGMLIPPDQNFTMRLSPPPRGDVLLFARITREADLLLPRPRAVVRHAAEMPGHLAAVDIGMALELTPEQKDEEQRLRQELHRHPENAPAALALAQLLSTQGRWDEAEHFYQHAITQARHLPDSGERAQLELEQLRVRRAEEGLATHQPPSIKDNDTPKSLP